MARQQSIDPSIKFYHVMHPDGGDGITVGFRPGPVSGLYQFAVFEQSQRRGQGYNKRVGRMATAGRIAKDKYQEVVVKEGQVTILAILQAAFTFWCSRNTSPIDILYVRSLFKLHYDKMAGNKQIEPEEIPSVLH